MDKILAINTIIIGGMFAVLLYRVCDFVDKRRFGKIDYFVYFGKLAAMVALWVLLIFSIVGGVK